MTKELVEEREIQGVGLALTVPEINLFCLVSLHDLIVNQEAT